MEWWVYCIICNLAMMIIWMAGLIMVGLGLFLLFVFNYFIFGIFGWMYFKLLFLVLMIIYYFWNKCIIWWMEVGECFFFFWQYRLLNEMFILFLIFIFYIVVYGKVGILNYFYFVGGIIVFVGLIFLGVWVYKKAREKVQRGQ